ASSILNNYDFQITEVHHKNKKDAPSGTALKIAKEIEKGLKSSGCRSIEPEIPINAVRAGGVIGKHEVMIVGDDDKIEISHESFSRQAFAKGALRAVEFLYGKTGYFEMNDVLSLNKILNDYIDKENSVLHKRYQYYERNGAASKVTI
ncbi:MAG TPA: dihydrodipicolinate reductase C-terminal domain-containing protein, partial [Ruminiclostridium sp.]|nr:dihydrodipicolinate reductase C-terminal domain-containing protein [Ruminiclostridium sp.]